MMSRMEESLPQVRKKLRISSCLASLKHSTSHCDAGMAYVSKPHAAMAGFFGEAVGSGVCDARIRMRDH